MSWSTYVISLLPPFEPFIFSDCHPGETVPSLQALSTSCVERIIRKKTSEEKDPICRSLLSLTEEQQETAEKVAGWVELLPPGVVLEIFSRLVNYDGENGRKMTPMDVWVFIHPGFKQVRRLTWTI